ncbi:MAG: hypothetical protein M3501_02105 [Actinomycetota bacterium]|nr:hypothetical protein [Actinomycetota bacterium]
MELGPGVFVPAHDAQSVLDLLHEAAARRQERGVAIPLPVRGLAAELARAARVERDRVFRLGTSRRTETGTGLTMEHMTTSEAANALGITQRAVIAKLHRGTLDGVQQTGGRWLLRLNEESAT